MTGSDEDRARPARASSASRTAGPSSATLMSTTGSAFRPRIRRAAEKPWRTASARRPSCGEPIGRMSAMCGLGEVADGVPGMPASRAWPEAGSTRRGAGRGGRKRRSRPGTWARSPAWALRRATDRRTHDRGPARSRSRDRCRRLRLSAAWLCAPAGRPRMRAAHEGDKKKRRIALDRDMEERREELPAGLYVVATPSVTSAT